MKTYDIYLVLDIAFTFSINMILKGASMQNFPLFGFHGCMLPLNGILDNG